MRGILLLALGAGLIWLGLSTAPKTGASDGSPSGGQELDFGGQGLDDPGEAYGDVGDLVGPARPKTSVSDTLEGSVPEDPQADEAPLMVSESSQEQGLEAFSDNERESAGQPLSGGPFKPVLEALHKIQSAYPIEGNPIRTALVTARSAPAHKRVVLTLREWEIRIDEALFLGGRSKGEFLKTFGADIFFDDQQVHIESAKAHVASAHVPSGVTNE